MDRNIKVSSVSNSTTSEWKNGFLLIETFRKLINPQNYSHLDQLWVAIFMLSWLYRGKPLIV